MKHNKCNHKFKMKPSNFLAGNRCPKCKNLKTTKQFKSYVSKKENGKYSVLGEYTGIHNKIKIKHNKCGYEYMVRPSGFYGGNRCPKCSKFGFTKGEKIINKFFSKKDIKNKWQFSFNDCKNKNTLSFDFKIKDKPIVIEYNGIQHYKPVEHFGGKEKFEYQQQNDQIKKEYCQANNIKLITIPYWEKDNIEEILEEELQEVM